MDQLLFRAEKEHGKKRINWDEFMIFFTRRGKLREGEELFFSGLAIEEIHTARIESQRYAPEDPEAQKFRLQRDLKEKLVGKQNLVRQGGKGKYDVTVPNEFDFMKKPRNVRTIRQDWLDNELKKQQKAEEKLLNSSFKANEIPRTTSQPLYQKILRKDAERRQSNKEKSIAKTKALEKPFSFHERDLKKVREALNLNDDIDTNLLTQFRARIVPWRILIPRFKMMMEKEEHDRETRIRQNAEKSFAMAKLPPRMQAHEDERRRRIEEDLDTTQASTTTDMEFNFQPPRARSVPNFRKLQKAFVTKME